MEYQEGTLSLKFENLFSSRNYIDGENKVRSDFPVEFFGSDVKDTAKVVMKKNQRKMEINLLKLCKEERGLGRIKVEVNKKFLRNFSKLLNSIESRSGLSLKEIAQKVGIHPDLLYHYKSGRRKPPLCVLHKLGQTFKQQIEGELDKVLTSIGFLSYSSGKNLKKSYAPKRITRALCYLVGSIMADGSLVISKTSKGLNYRINIYDFYESNLKLAKKWIKEAFKVNVKVKKSKRDNCWYIRFSNKVIFLYFTEFFGIKVGKKYDILEFPKLLLHSEPTHKLALIAGFSLFDGSFSLSKGIFSISSKSRRLLKQFQNILFEELKIDTKIEMEKRTYTLIVPRRHLKSLVGILPNSQKRKMIEVYLEPEKFAKNKRILQVFTPIQRRNLNTILDNYGKVPLAEIAKKLKFKNLRSLTPYISLLKRLQLIGERSGKTNDR